MVGALARGIGIKYDTMTPDDAFPGNCFCEAQSERVFLNCCHGVMVGGLARGIWHQA